ncbi:MULTISPECIES: antitoxin [unclassified Streptomyces]|uniref:antitoxin n=1 Tax=unclassified Streptomyces TaxID=2593676 RepID=UPI0036F6AA05
MGLLGHPKAGLGPAKGWVPGLAQRHEDRIRHGLDRAARTVGQRTGGTYGDRIRPGTDRAKGGVDRFAHENDPGPDAGGAAPTPPAGPPPAS